MLQFTAFGDEYGLGRFTRLIAVRGDLFDKIQTLDNVAKDACKTAHLLQYYAKLRADKAKIVVTFLSTTHTNGTSDGGKLGVIWHKVTVVEYTPTSASIVGLEITGYDALTVPALKYRATFVAYTYFACCQNTEVFGHFWRRIRSNFYNDAPVRRAVHLDVKVVHGIRVGRSA